MGNEFIPGISDSEIGDEIGNLLLSGEWQLLSPGNPHEISREEQEVIANAKIEFIYGSVITPFMEQLRRNDPSRSQAERDLYDFFSKAKNKNKSKEAHAGGGNSELTRKAIILTEIQDVYDFADVQFDHFARELGKIVPRTYEYAEALRIADYWSKAEQIAKGAVEIGFQRGFL